MRLGLSVDQRRAHHHIAHTQLASKHNLRRGRASCSPHKKRAAMEDVYRPFYIDTRAIRKALATIKQNVERQPQGMRTPDGQFTDLMSDELHKVNQFAVLKQQELTMEMQVCARDLKGFTRLIDKESSPTSSLQCTLKSSPRKFQSGSGARGASLTEQEKQTVLLESEGTILEISKEIVHLHKFVRSNFSAFVRSSLAFDELFGRSSSPWFVAQLIREPFANLDLERLLITLSLCWEKHREAVAQLAGRKRDTGANDTWKPPESFVRNTTKYWLRPDQVPAAKAFMVRYVPYLIFGYSSKQLEFLIDPFELECDRPSESTPVKEGQLVSSVYLDSEDAHCYNRRLSRYEGAQLIRCRWYGENDGDPYKEIFIERKTHHEGWSGESSAKERFALPQKRVFDFLKGKVDIDEWATYLARTANVSRQHKKIANLLRLGREISTSIQSHRLQPMVRTSYLRSAFQAANNNDVRFSLDVNLCMVNEYQPQFHPQPPWCRVSEEILGKNEVVRFPYAVLEVKLQCQQPAWVSRMLCESNAKMVYKFSKFQHGMAFLHRERVAQYGVPHWIPDFENRGFIPGFNLTNATDTPTRGMLPGMTGILEDSYNTDATNKQNSSAAGHINSRAANQPDPALDNSSTSPLYASPFGKSSQLSRYNALLTGERRSLLLASFYPGARRRPGRLDPSFVGLTRMRGHILAQKKDDLLDDEEQQAMQRRFLEEIHARAQTVTKLDPKSVLASERTLLHYIKKALYLAALALVLIERGGTSTIRGLGVFLSAVCILSIMLSYVVYQRRTEKILDRKCKSLHRERLDSEWAPRATFLLLTSALIGSMVVAYWQ